ncbi:MAG TPA: hypothetical protein VJ489_00900 [Thermoplasmata archaeon]|nr:hypothetical protein [Thermoplasmata archaeon]
MMHLSKQGKAIWFLAFLSPVIAEMLSGSSPIIEWLNPIVIAIFLGMYGAGAILARELTIRWNKGWACIIVLGAAYGIIEEGIAVKSFFDPGWVDLGELAAYGRYLDVNWVWSVWLTIFHSMVSIALVLLIFGLIYPEYRGVRLLTERRFRIVSVIFVLDILLSAIGFVYIQDFVPPIGWYLLTFVVVAGLVLLAKHLPKNLISPRHESPTWSNASFFALGFLTFPTFIITAASAPDSLNPLFIIALLLLMSAALLLLLQHKLGALGNDLPKAYYAVGFLWFFILFSFINELGGLVSVSVGGMIFIVFTSLLIHKVRSYARPNTSLGPLASLRMRKRRRTVSNR